MLTRIFFLVAFTNLSMHLFAQADTVLIIVELTDKEYKEPLQNVNGTFDYGIKGKILRSNSKGQIAFYSPVNETISYSLNHPLYESKSGIKKVGALDFGDTLMVRIELTSIKRQDVKEVVVKAPGIPDTVYSSKRLSVADFEVQRNGDLVLLVYPKNLKKGSELLLYNGIDVINSFAVPGTAEEIIRDYRGNAHVVCADNVYGIHVNQHKIGIATIEKPYYLKYIAPIVDTNHTKMYFSNFNKDYPEFSYFSFDQLDSTYSKIINIKDDLMMELYRSEYKWADVRTKLWAKNLELETGIDAEVYVGANYFTQSLYYKELYAPLFHRNDSLFVFDYYDDKLFTFDAAGNKLDSISIYHHYHPKSTGWKKQLLQDQVTGQVYAVYDKAGFTYLGRVDTKTGEIAEKVRLEFRYIDKISIHNNFIYYVYRPYESVQKKFLYKERLPYDYEVSILPYGNEISNEMGK